MSTSSMPFSNDHLSDAPLVIPQTVMVVQWERDINYLRELAHEWHESGAHFYEMNQFLNKKHRTR